MSRPKHKKHKEKELLRAILRNDESQIVRLAASRPGLDALQIGGAIVSYQRMRQDPRGRNITPLLVAVHFGELELCKYLIQEEVDVNAGFLHGLKPLSLALDYKHYEIAKLLIDSGADVNQQNENGETAMEYAISEYSPVKIVEDLLAAGVDKNAALSPKTTYTPIAVAVVCNNVSLVKYLLDQAVNLDVLDEQTFTPLGMAIFLNHTEVTEVLLKKSAKVDGLGKGDIPPVCIALLHLDGKVLKSVVNAGANVHVVAYPATWTHNVLNGEGHLTTLHLAVANLNFEGVKILLENGLNVNSTDEVDGLTPIQIMMKRKENELEDSQRERYRKIYQILLECGADLNVTFRGFTVLQRVVEDKNWIAVEEMVKVGVNINAPLKVHFSTFHYVIINDKFELAKLCLEFGAYVLSPVHTPHGTLPFIEILMTKASVKLQKLVVRHIFSGSDYLLRTAHHRHKFETIYLHYDFALSRAIQTNKILLAKFSLEAGAKITKGCVFDLRQPLHHPIVKKNHELFTLLLQHGVHVQVPYPDQSTYLHLAMKICSFEVVRVLLAHGACYNYKDAKGITPVKVQKQTDGTAENEPLPFDEGLALIDSKVEEKLKYMYIETKKMDEEKWGSSEESFSSRESENGQRLGRNEKSPGRSDQTREQKSKFLKNKEILPVMKEITLSKNKIRVKSNESSQFGSKLPKKELKQDKEPNRLLKDVSRMFSMVRRGDAKVLKLLEAKKKKKPEEFLSYINCINRRGNTLMSEAVMLGLGDIAEGIMKLRLEEP